MGARPAKYNPLLLSVVLYNPNQFGPPGQNYLFTGVITNTSQTAITLNGVFLSSNGPNWPPNLIFQNPGVPFLLYRPAETRV